MTIGQILRKKQPKEYALLMSWIYIDQSEDQDKAHKEIERLMRHDAYVRKRGSIRQVRHGVRADGT